MTFLSAPPFVVVMGGILVLIVDDASGVRASVRLALSRHPGIAEIIEAENGHIAVELARRSPDVVIMDITMPGMDGHSATKEIVSALPATRVNMHSAISDRAEVERAWANGAVGFVDKGRTHEIVPAITAALAGAHLHRLADRRQRQPELAAVA